MTNQYLNCPDFEEAMNRIRIEGQTNHYLYYYTNPDTFFKILDSRCIKTSKYDNVNDLDEANLDCLNGHSVTKKIDQFIRENCHFISFVHDYRKYGVIIEGVQHPRMWAQYAQNNEGVCFILNKKKLLKKCRKTRRHEFVMIGNIRYRWSKYSDEEQNDIDVFCANSSIEEILKKYSRHIFLTKHVDWEQEHEIRLCLMGNRDDDMIDIDGCIEGICLGNKFMDNSERIAKLAERLICSNKKYCDQIKSNAFGVISYPKGNYDAWPIHPSADEKIANIINLLNRFRCMV